jgi:hypothetical protein
MDKIIRNVIIFAVIIMAIAAVAVAVIWQKNNSGNNVTGLNTNTGAGNNLGTAGNINTGTTVTGTGEIQDVKLTVTGGTYILTPSVLKKGVPVRMEADLTTVRGCSRDIVISAFGVRKYVKEGDNVITFTPTKTGTINIACSMNMYRGTFTVVDSGSASTGTNVQGLSATDTPVQETTQSALSGNTNPATHTCGSSGGGCGCGASTGGCGG